MNMHINAVRRYAALAGDLKEMSKAEQAQAIADRESFGDDYLPKQGSGWDKAARDLPYSPMAGASVYGGGHPAKPGFPLREQPSG
jgi:hypothetical protein